MAARKHEQAEAETRPEQEAAPVAAAPVRNLTRERLVQQLFSRALTKLEYKLTDKEKAAHAKVHVITEAERNAALAEAERLAAERVQ